MTTTVQRAWYQEPMVWMIIAIPATSVVVGITMLTISVKHYDGLVTDDYYKEGLGINESIQRGQKAKELGIEASIDFNQSGNLVSLSIQGGSSFSLPRELTLHLRHSTRSGYDQTWILPLALDNRYSGELPELVAGKWYVELESSDWKITGQITLPFEQQVLKLGALVDVN
jgi:hypothetical protein